MQLKIMNFALVPCLLLAASSANAAVFKGDSCSALHMQSAEPQEVTEATQDNTLNWQFARAVYLRDLDYENLNAHYPKVDDYKVKRDLIESKYHLALAEAEVTEANDMATGQSELQVAQCYVNRALINAGNNDLSQLKVVKNELNGISKSPQQDLNYCNDKQAALAQFHNIENEVGSLLLNL